MSEIALEGVTKTYDDIVAVDDVSLRVRDGELLVLVGPSGCGKTTLLRLIAGLERPTAGEVYIDGERSTDVPARHRDVALVFQDFALFPHLSVRENLAFNLRMRGGYPDIAERVERTAELLAISDLLDRSIDELSGGQQQRVALGRAIAAEPRAFLLDEPLANLDAQLRSRMQTEIARLQQRLGITTIHVTHNQEEAMTMADRVAVLNDGRLQQVAPPETVYDRPATEFVARFIGHPPMNLVRGRFDASAGEVDVDGVEPIRVSPLVERTDWGPEVLVGVRPEAVAVEPAPSRGWVEATVDFVEFHGANKFIYLDAPALPELVARMGAETKVEAGSAVSVSFDRERLHLFDADSGSRLPLEQA